MREGETQRDIEGNSGVEGVRYGVESTEGNGWREQ